MDDAKDVKNIDSNWPHLQSVVFGHESRRHHYRDWCWGLNLKILEYLPQKRKIIKG